MRLRDVPLASLLLVQLLAVSGGVRAQEGPYQDPQTPMPLLLTDPSGEEAPLPQDAAEPPKAPLSPYKILFYDNDFSYLGEPGASRDHYYEWLKWLTLTEKLRLDFGGEYRHQFKVNDNQRALFLGAPTDPQGESYFLNRVRAYADVHYGNWIRGYVEYIDASIADNTLPPLLIDEDRSDLLNAFADIRIPAMPADTFLRVGRQELLYGEQRLISPLDWANTRRTFDQGIKGFLRSETWDVDVFFGRPSIVDGAEFNQADQSQWFGGVYTTYLGMEHSELSPYFLILREEDVIPGPVTGMGHRNGSGMANNLIFTAGFELQGEKESWLWDIETAFQFGRYGALDVFAGFFTSGIGRKFDLPLAPVVWMWYDYASGDLDPFDNTVTTFNQLFPLGHKYFGFIDLVARQNVHDVNFQIFLKPHKKLSLLLWTHFMFLASDKDGLYNVAGVVSFQDPAGNSGSTIGQEVDLLATWTFSPAMDLGIGYSYFWSGDFIKNNGGNSFANFLYTQAHVRF